MSRMPGDINKLLKQAQQMQAAMQEAQSEVEAQTFEASAGGGVVTAVVNGSGKLVSVTIDPSVIDPDDPELLGDLIVAATNQAIDTAQQAVSAVMGSVAGFDPGEALGGLLGG